MSSFRLALLSRVCGDYARSLSAAVDPTGQRKQRGSREEEEEESGLEPDITSDEVRMAASHLHPFLYF
jgi:hypothetical protein